MRSLLFVPGNRPERYAKAATSGADAIVLDLEDAVPPDEKIAARSAARAWRDVPDTVRCILRVNAVDTPWFEEDLTCALSPSVSAVMLPKAESRPVVEHVVRVTGKPVIALVESAIGFAAVDAVAGSHGLERLAFGSLDLQVDLGMHEANEDDLLGYRTALVLASRVARIRPPIDGVTTKVDDAATIRADAQRARRLGFAGKLCIHPRQVPLVHAVYEPSVDEVAWARRVVEAMRLAAGNAVRVDGAMVDRPVVLRAEAILAHARAPEAR